MEFDNVGRHCEHEHCNQKDFLPFKCEKCHKNLCYIHRSEVAHKCVNKDMNDMTSLDCPICKKSFKLSKAEDPNEAWDRHFSTSCSQVAGADKKQTLKCASPTCNVTLGPSNRFQCPQCRKLVCLGCRTPQSHSCVATKEPKSQKSVAELRAIRFSSNQKTSSISASKKISSKSTKESHSENTLRGSAQRRMERSIDKNVAETPKAKTSHEPVGVVPPLPSSYESNTPSRFECPFCFERYLNSAELEVHVDRHHGTPSTTSPPITSLSQVNNISHSSTTYNEENSSNPEVCPTCQRRFPDVMSLIQHAEREHPGFGEGSTSHNDEGSRRRGEGGSQNKEGCYLS